MASGPTLSMGGLCHPLMLVDSCVPPSRPPAVSHRTRGRGPTESFWVRVCIYNGYFELGGRCRIQTKQRTACSCLSYLPCTCTYVGSRHGVVQTATFLVHQRIRLAQLLQTEDSLDRPVRTVTEPTDVALIVNVRCCMKSWLFIVSTELTNRPPLTPPHHDRRAASDCPSRGASPAPTMPCSLLRALVLR